MPTVKQYRTLLQTENDSSEVYLGKPEAWKKVEWQKERNAYALVLKGDVGRNANAASNDLKPKVLLTALLQIAPDKFFMNPETNWTPSIGWKLDASKLSFVGIHPSDYKVLATDSMQVIENIKALEGMIVAGEKSKASVLRHDNNVPGLHFKHHLFVKKTREAEDDKDLREKAGYNILTWPVHNAQTKDEFKTLSSEFEIRPLPAYKADNSLLDPSEYVEGLRNAVVKVQFTLSSWVFPNQITFTTDIVSINVVDEGHPDRHSAMPKQKRRAIDDAGITTERESSLASQSSNGHVNNAQSSQHTQGLTEPPAKKTKGSTAGKSGH